MTETIDYDTVSLKDYDAEIKRYRWEKNPNYIVHETGDNTVTVYDESKPIQFARLFWDNEERVVKYVRHLMASGWPEAFEAAEDYFKLDTDKLTESWQQAKVNEVWFIPQFNRSYTVVDIDGVRHFVAVTETGKVEKFRVTDPTIVTAQMAWSVS